MPTGTPFKRWIPGAAVVTALAICGVLLWRGADRRAPPRPPGRVAATAPGPLRWLVTERSVPPSALLRDLQARYEDARDDATRAFALGGAAKLGEPAAVVWLATLAAKERPPGGPATHALGQITNRLSGLELGDVATSDGPPHVRAAAIAALVTCGELAQAAQLASLVADGNQPFQVRQAAANTLGQMRRPGAVPALAATLEGLQKDSTRQGRELRLATLQALGLIGTQEAREVLEAQARGPLSPAERTVVDNGLRPR